MKPKTYEHKKNKLKMLSKNLIVIFIGLLTITTSCVQKTYKKIVVFTVDVSGIKKINKVGVRGENKPLDWNYDTEMKVIKKDSLYQATVVFETGYKFAEIKFTVNDEFELKEKDNRRINFSEKGTTLYNAKFDFLNKKNR
jgi:hypothetical protein